MKRHRGLVPLSHEHRQILFVAQLIKRGVARYHGAPATVVDKLTYARQALTDLVLPHAQREESIVFATVVGRDSEVDAMLAELRSEHQQFIELHKVLEEEASDLVMLEGQLDQLGWLLDTHIRSEERRLFQRLQALLSDSELDAIGAAWQNEAGPQCR
jgi:iron-sulfur cluster repair protein YtfE (RIC family)